MAKNTAVESGFLFHPPETPLEPMEFLSRSWSLSALQVSKALAPLSKPKLSDTDGTVLEDVAGEALAPFSFASWETSTQLIVDRIMSQSASQEVSPRTSGRSSHSSGPMAGASLHDISPSEFDSTTAFGGGKAAGRWLIKEKKDKRREETRPAQHAQLHACVSVAGVAAAVAAIAAATASSSGSAKDQELARTDVALASAATLVAAQCVEAAEALGADRDHLASVVSSAVNVRSADYIMTLTAAAATALRGAVKARALKEVSSVASVLPMEKGIISGGGGGFIGSHTDELVLEDNFLGICTRKLLARGCELLKRTRKGDLHWKVVSVYINRTNQVTLKMKSRHVAGTLTKKKKYVVLEVVKGMPAWAGRYLLEGGENRRYFGLKTADRGLIEFECRSQREYEAWTDGVSRLISLAAERTNVYRIRNDS